MNPGAAALPRGQGFHSRSGVLLAYPLTWSRGSAQTSKNCPIMLMIPKSKNSNTLSFHNWTEMLWKWSVLWDCSCSHYSAHILSVSVKCSNVIKFQNLGRGLCKITPNILLLEVHGTVWILTVSSSSECSHNREGDTAVLLIFPQAEPSLLPSTFPFRACEERHRIQNPNTVHITVRIIYFLTVFLKICIYININ